MRSAVKTERQEKEKTHSIPIYKPLVGYRKQEIFQPHTKSDDESEKNIVRIRNHAGHHVRHFPLYSVQFYAARRSRLFQSRIGTS